MTDVWVGSSFQEGLRMSGAVVAREEGGMWAWYLKATRAEASLLLDEARAEVSTVNSSGLVVSGVGFMKEGFGATFSRLAKLSSRMVVGVLLAVGVSVDKESSPMMVARVTEPWSSQTLMVSMMAEVRFAGPLVLLPADGEENDGVTSGKELFCMVAAGCCWLGGGTPNCERKGVIIIPDEDDEVVVGRAVEPMVGDAVGRGGM